MVPHCVRFSCPHSAPPEILPFRAFCVSVLSGHLVCVPHVLGVSWMGHRPHTPLKLRIIANSQNIFSTLSACYHLSFCSLRFLPMPMLTLPPSVALTSSNNPSALSNHSAGPVAHNSTSRPGVGEWEESDCTMPEIVRKLSPGCLVPYYCLWQVWGLLEFVFFFSFYLDVTKQSWDEHLGWIIGINTVNIKTWQHWAHHSLGSLITPDDGSTAKGGITTD